MEVEKNQFKLKNESFIFWVLRELANSGRCIAYLKGKPTKTSMAVVAGMPLIPALRRLRQVDFYFWGQPSVQSEFQESQGYTEKPCLESPLQPNPPNSSQKQAARVVTRESFQVIQSQFDIKG